MRGRPPVRDFLAGLLLGAITVLAAEALMVHVAGERYLREQKRRQVSGDA